MKLILRIFFIDFLLYMHIYRYTYKISDDIAMFFLFTFSRLEKRIIFANYSLVK